MADFFEELILSEPAEEDTRSPRQMCTPEWRERRDAMIRRYHQLGLCPIPLQGKKPYQKGWQKEAQYREKSTE